MTTATKTKLAAVGSKSEKHRIAAELTDLLEGRVIIEYMPANRFKHGDWRENASKGHIFHCNMPDVDEDLRFWPLDDRDGDVRQLLADELREHGELFLKWASTIEGVKPVKAKSK